MLTIGIFSALGLLLLVLKAGGRKAIGHDVLIDVFITGILMVAFYGTYSGMTAAMVGGLVASIVLFVLKKTVKHEVIKLETIRKKLLGINVPLPKVSWQTKEPEWRHHNQYWRKDD